MVAEALLVSWRDTPARKAITDFVQGVTSEGSAGYVAPADKTEQQAQIELGRLLKEASEGRTPESGATMAELLDEYAASAPWDVSTTPAIRRAASGAQTYAQIG